MSERTDRRMPGNRVLLGILVVMLTLVVSGSSMLWLRMRPPDEPPKPVVEGSQPLVQQSSHDETMLMTLYYPYDGMLALGTFSVTRQPDTQSQARELLSALFANQRASQAPVFQDIQLRAFYLDASGTAYIDLTPALQQDIHASAWEELLAIYAMVDTLMQNFTEIKQVSLLLDGREAQTLAGHVDLSRKFTKRMDLVKQ